VPLAPLLAATAEGRLAEVARSLDIAGSLLPVVPGSAAGVVLAAAGYPEAPRSGDAISGIDDARATGALVFCAGVEGTPTEPVTGGGRVLTVVGRGTAPGTAIERAYAAVAQVSFEGMQLRSDIGRTVEPALVGVAS
jgi:phosphoribosylamine--glycine ligase